MSDVQVQQSMAASAEVVYDLVSDVTRMGEWSPETTQCRWLDGATRPSVGARFRGTNRFRFYRWSTTCTVTAADPARRFAFRVEGGPVPVADWSYDIAPVDGGCVVTESWTDRRPRWLRVAGAVSMGILDRAAHNRTGMQATLAALKEAAESSVAEARSERPTRRRRPSSVAAGSDQAPSGS